MQNSLCGWFNLQISPYGIKNNLEVIGVSWNNNLVIVVKFRQNCWRIMSVCHVSTNSMMTHVTLLKSINILNLNIKNIKNYFFQKKKEKKGGGSWATQSRMRLA